MAYTYDDVLALLLGWGDTKPPKRIVDKALRAGMTPDQVADLLTKFVWRAADPPKGYGGDPWDYKLYKTFGGGGHYNLDFANIALGFSPEPDPLPSKPRAYTAEDAWELALLGWYYTGDTRFLDLDTEAGKAEFARRWQFGLYMPLSWEGVDPKLYLYLSISGQIETEPVAFSVRVSEEAVKLLGFNLQKWLDNQWAVREMLPAPWGPGGVRQ